MSKAQPKDQPSVEELLASIREAIYEDDEPRAGVRMTARKDTAPQGRKAAGHRPAKHAPARSGPTAVPPARAERSRHGAQGAYNGAGTRDLAPPSGSMRGLRVSLEHGTQGQGRVSTRTDDFLAMRERLSTITDGERAAVGGTSEGFAGILGGDVRLEEALARLSRAGRPRSEELERPLAPPMAPRARPLEAADLERLVDRQLRPAIRDVVDTELQALAAEPASGPQETAPYDPHHGGEAYGGDAYGGERPGTWDEAAAGPREAYYPEAGEPYGHDAGAAGYDYPPEDAAAARYHGGWQGGPYPPLAYPPQPMMAPEAADQTASAFNRLADTIMNQATGGERSIEDITRELLRPMLKSWLDHNLPAVVERLVREEIERVARRGGR